MSQFWNTLGEYFWDTGSKLLWNGSPSPPIPFSYLPPPPLCLNRPLICTFFQPSPPLFNILKSPYPLPPPFVTVCNWGFKLWVYLRRPYSSEFFKGCLQQILLGPLLNTLSQIDIAHILKLKMPSSKEYLRPSQTSIKMLFCKNSP